MAITIRNTLADLHDAFPQSDVRMPALFIGHGSPMNALDDNVFSRAWIETATNLPQPNAILCVSAHWETTGTLVTGMDAPRTIHDFGGFPRALFEKEYPAPGSPALARLTQQTIHHVGVQLDQKWGLDHGAWSVLCRMYPSASIPIVQLSLDRTQPPAHHYALARELASLRNRGVLVVGSGNIVHNLGLAVFDDTLKFDWAIDFDDVIRKLIEAGDHASIINYEKLGRAALIAIPTNEHYLPLLYILALQGKQEALSFFTEQVTYGALSMRSFRIG